MVLPYLEYFQIMAAQPQPGAISTGTTASCAARKLYPIELCSERRRSLVLFSAQDLTKAGPISSATTGWSMIGMNQND